MKALLKGFGMALLAVALMGAADERPSDGKPDVHADVLVLMILPAIKTDTAGEVSPANNQEK